jgi:hypothetical protein
MITAIAGKKKIYQQFYTGYRTVSGPDPQNGSKSTKENATPCGSQLRKKENYFEADPGPHIRV